MNKLWVCRSTAENIKRAEKYEYFKANDRYCLVITDKTPEKMAEVTDDAVRSLTMQDWAWIQAVGERMLRLSGRRKSLFRGLKKNSEVRRSE